MSDEVPAHPAPFHPRIINEIAEQLSAYARARSKRKLWVLDPFAGIGGVHELRDLVEGVKVETVGIELMPRWAEAHENTIVGNCIEVMGAMRAQSFDAVITSPSYGNRMADHHDNRDVCKTCGGFGKVKSSPDALTATATCPTCKGTGLSHRRSYAHYYGRDAFLNDAPIEVNTGAMQWGREYRWFHIAAWRGVHRVLRRGGVFLLNVKNHYRGRELVGVADWHDTTCQAIGFSRDAMIGIDTPGFRYGENHEARDDEERLYVFTRS